MVETGTNPTRIFHFMMISPGLIILIQGMMFAKAVLISCMLAADLAIILIGPQGLVEIAGGDGLAFTLGMRKGLAYTGVKDPAIRMRRIPY